MVVKLADSYVHKTTQEISIHVYTETIALANMVSQKSLLVDDIFIHILYNQISGSSL